MIVNVLRCYRRGLTGEPPKSPRLLTALDRDRVRIDAIKRELRR